MAKYGGDMANEVPNSEDRAAGIAAHLNRLREQASISVETLSAQTGISQRTLYRKLNANPPTLTLRELILITDALGTTIRTALEVAA